MSAKEMKIAGRRIGPDHPVYVIAELSANHNQSYDRAVELIAAAKDAGADAVKLQTYTPDTMTIDCSKEYFRIGKGTIWEGRTLYDLYSEATTPWEWQLDLKGIAENLGMALFSTPFDVTAVEFLEELNVPAYKVASFEVTDVHLIRAVAATQKPIIISTGMATVAEIGQAVAAVHSTGNQQVALLKCTSAYPAHPKEMDLRTIPDLARRFSTVVGLSDHTLGTTVAVASVTLGARIVEKHLTLSRRDPGPDSAFSLESDEFKKMVDAIRTTEQALGEIRYGLRDGELPSVVFRRSLFVVDDIAKGEVFTHRNIRSIRPGHGLPPALIDRVIDKVASRDLSRGEPLCLDDISETQDFGKQ